MDNSGRDNCGRNNCGRNNCGRNNCGRDYCGWDGWDKIRRRGGSDWRVRSGRDRCERRWGRGDFSLRKCGGFRIGQASLLECLHEPFEIDFSESAAFRQVLVQSLEQPRMMLGWQTSDQFSDLHHAIEQRQGAWSADRTECLLRGPLAVGPLAGSLWAIERGGPTIDAAVEGCDDGEQHRQESEHQQEGDPELEHATTQKRPAVADLAVWQAEGLSEPVWWPVTGVASWKTPGLGGATERIDRGG